MKCEVNLWFLCSVRLSFLDKVTRLISSRWIDRRSADLDVLDLTVLIDNKCRSGTIAGCVVIKSVFFSCYSFPITKKRKAHFDILRKSFVCRRTVH